MGVFVRRVKTASGATAVQIVQKRGRRVLGIEHIGSAHTEDELALLLQLAEERRHAGQLTLDLDDGVKVNYAKFGDLLAEVKAVTGTAAD